MTMLTTLAATPPVAAPGDAAPPPTLAEPAAAPATPADLWQKVLIVEDVPPERARLAAMLRKQGYAVAEACNGAEAQALLQTDEFGLIISDWCMPVMDGMQLLQALHAATQPTPCPYFILLTGQDAVCDLIAALDAGADDFIRKPFHAEELRARVQAGARIVRLRHQLQEQNRTLNHALARESQLNQAIQADLSAAASLQRSLLPPETLSLNGLALSHYFRPAAGVAGDTYSIVPLNEQEIAFYQIDVAGHGVRAALLSFSLSQFLSDPSAHGFSLTETDARGRALSCSPARVVSELNQRFKDRDDCRNYFTMVYGTLNRVTGQGLLCQAGHPAPLRASPDGSVQAIGTGGLPVGALDEARYDEVPFQLDAGDTLLVYSDGLQSCVLPNGRPLDESALRQILARSATLPAAALRLRLENLVDNLLRDRTAEDDISLMVLQRPAGADNAAAARQPD